MKKIRTIIAAVILAVTMLVPAPAYAAGKAVNLTMEDVSSRISARKAKKLARRIGGMRKIRSSKYRTACYKGNKVYIGVNNVNPSPTRPFLYIRNNGNRRLKYKGVKIGAGKSSVDRKFGTGWKSGKNQYVYGPAGFTLRCWFKNGRLKKWTYTAAYTS